MTAAEIFADGTVRYFGKDIECPYCNEPIKPTENCKAIGNGEGGWNIFHVECFVRMFFGSVAHQQRRCFCFGGTVEDEEKGMTTREAAKAAFKFLIKEREASVRAIRRHFGINEKSQERE